MSNPNQILSGCDRNPGHVTFSWIISKTPARNFTVERLLEPTHGQPKSYTVVSKSLWIRLEPGQMIFQVNFLENCLYYNELYDRQLMGTPM
jgi:hypothetical protein